MLKKLPEKPLFSITAGELYDYPLFLLSRFHVAKTVKGMKGGLKAFTALNDYYMHIQTRDIEQFPVRFIINPFL